YVTWRIQIGPTWRASTTVSRVDQERVQRAFFREETSWKPRLRIGLWCICASAATLAPGRKARSSCYFRAPRTKMDGGCDTNTAQMAANVSFATWVRRAAAIERLTMGKENNYRLLETLIGPWLKTNYGRRRGRMGCSLIGHASR